MVVLAFALAVIAFTFSFPFLVAKSEQASYMTKVHFPFLMSNRLGDEVMRNVMVDVLQNMREIDAVLTVLLGSSTEVSLILGNFFLFIAALVHNGGGSDVGIATVAILNLGASILSFYLYIVFCMKIMVYRARETFVFACCCCFFMCVPAETEEQTQLVKMDLNIGDTNKFYASDWDMPFKSKKYSAKYTLDRDHHTSDQFEVALDLNAVQHDIASVGGKSLFKMRDRFGLLSIVGDAHLHNLERKDAVQVRS